jgi:hypothetical protein
MAAFVAIAPIYVLGSKAVGFAYNKIQDAVRGQPDLLPPKVQNSLAKAYEESMMVTNSGRVSDGFKLYAKIVGLAATISSTGSFDAYAKDHVKLSNFSKIKIPGSDTTLTEQLKGEDNKEVREALEGVFALTANTKAKQKEYTDELTAINNFLADPESTYKPRDVVAYLHVLKDQGRKAITEQQDVERVALEGQFKGAEGAKLQEALGIEPEDTEAFEKVKTDMLAQLKQSQEKELEKFDKANNDTLNKLHEVSARERARVARLARLEVMDERNSKEIEKLREANIKPDDAMVSVSFSDKDKRAHYKGMSPSDFPTVYGVTGRPITYNKESQTFSIDLPNRIFSPLYYSGWKSDLKSDMMEIAESVWACGYSHIEMSVEHSDPEHALELAKQAYAAAREQGFDSDKVTVNVNGKVLSAKEIFKDDPSELEAIEQRAKLYSKQREEGGKELGSAKTMKENLTAHKEAHKERERTIEPDEPEHSTDLTV